MNDETRRLPIWHGGEVVAHALVNAADFLRLNRYRWRINYDKYRFPHRAVGKTNKRRSLSLSRAVMDAPRGVIVRHRNGDRLDCRRANLVVNGGSVCFRSYFKQNPWCVSISIDARHF